MNFKEVIDLVPAANTSDGAGVRIKRALGATPGQRLDPFLMLDEFGSDSADEYIAGFPSHPHRGFETVTYMLDGHMLHEDHLGNRGDLRSGDVQWMTAGRGIIHSEMPQQEEGHMRGFQLWINLPAKKKMCEPSYCDIPSKQIPVVHGKGFKVKIVAGNFIDGGVTTPGAITGRSTEPVYLDVHLSAGCVFEQPLAESLNGAIYVYEGRLSLTGDTGGTSIPAGHTAVLGEGDALRVVANDGQARFLLLAAKPIGEPVFQYGPFVMNTREEIEQAIVDYQNGDLTRPAITRR